MATTTKQNNQYCTTSPSIDANIGPWTSIEAYLAWLSSELGVETPQEGTEILVKDNTGAMTKYRYEVISGTPTWTTSASEVAVDSALDATSDNPVKNKVVAAAIANLQSAVDSAEDSAEDSAAAAAAASSSADRAAISAADASSSASRSTSLASQAAASATSANNSATSAARSLSIIQQAIEELDPSTSTEDAIVALTAQVAAQGAQIETLDDELDKAPTTDDVNDSDLEFSDDDEPANVILRCENGHVRTKYFYSGDIYTKSEVNALVGSGGVTQEQLNYALATKQDKLSSGNNIKTINGYSLLGRGNIDVNTSLHLKLVVIGNSYSADSFMYVPFILLNYGITIELGVYHRGGASLQNQVDEWNAGNGNASFWYINTKNQTSWQVVSSNYSPKQAINYKTWDIITIQQGSIASVDYANYSTAARSLINLITNEVDYPYTLAWNININRDSSGSDYTAIANQILTNINNICQREPVNLIFPYGTAIFNARTNSTLNAIGAGGSLYASDKVHLQEGLPCYVAAITNVQTLFNRFYPAFSVLNDGVGATITQAKIDEWGVRGQQGTCVGINANNCKLAQIAAILANRFNFEIKTIY